MANEKSLASMSAAERLAFYRSAVKTIKAAPTPSVSVAEYTAVAAAGVRNFGTNFVAAYKFHRVQ